MFEKKKKKKDQPATYHVFASESRNNLKKKNGKR
jgi:hypothetical protein